MARSVTVIGQIIRDKVSTTPALSVLSVALSNVGIWGMFVDSVAFCIQTLEQLFDEHRTDVDNALLTKDPHRTTWYKQISLNFQYGYDLVPDKHYYDNSSLTADQIATAQIVKYCAVVEVEINGKSALLIKIAGETGDELAPITTQQLSSFRFYMAVVKDAGVTINIVNFLPDKLFITLEVYYNPLLLDSSGASILNGNKPVEDSLKEFLRELPFNGELILASVVDKLQKTEGVDIPNIVFASSSWIDTIIGDYGVATPIYVKQVPVSGYFTIPDFTNITYIPNV